MHAERRATGVTLLAPTRTTRMNGGPRLAADTPLPPFRPLSRHSPIYSPPPHDSPLQPPPTKGMSVPAASVRLGRGPFEMDVETGVDEPLGASASSDFPLDAFIIPEGSSRLPAGLVEADRRQRQRALDLADRLEALAARLRRDGYTALARQTVHGDSVDALLAGILAGYLAAGDA